MVNKEAHDKLCGLKTTFNVAHTVFSIIASSIKFDTIKVDIKTYLDSDYGGKTAHECGEGLSTTEQQHSNSGEHFELGGKAAQAHYGKDAKAGDADGIDTIEYNVKTNKIQGGELRLAWQQAYVSGPGPGYGDKQGGGWHALSV